MLRDAAPRRHRAGAGARGRPGRSHRARDVRPRRGAAGARRRLRRFPLHRVGGLDGAGPHPRCAAARVAGAGPAARPRAASHRRPARLLLDGRRRADYRRHLGGGAHRRGSGAHRRPGARRRCDDRVRAVPAAGAPRRRGGDGRLLLPEQRRHRRAVPARSRLRPGGGARRGLPPRQRHPEHLLRAARRAVCVAARRPVGRVPVLPRLPRRGRHRRRRRLQPQLPAAARHRLAHLRPGPRRCLRQDRRLQSGCDRRLARRGHLRTRSDLRLPAHQRRLPAHRRDHRLARPADGLRDGGRLRRGRPRAERRERAGRIRGEDR